MTILKIKEFGLVFILFTLIVSVFVGFTPLSSEYELSSYTNTTSSSGLRQVVFTGIFIFSLFFSFLYRKKDISNLRQLIPFSIIISLCWVVLSLFWSPTPLISAKRFILMTMVILSVFALVKGLGEDKILRSFTLSLFLLVFISIFVSIIHPNGVHGVNSSDPSLVGAWKGLFVHKNTLGLASAITMIFSLYYWRLERKRTWLIYIFICFMMLVFSKSKTSLGLLIPTLVLGFLFEYYYLKSRLKVFYFLVLIFFIVCAILSFITYQQEVISFFSNPLALTGRVEIWHILWSVIEDNWLFGTGYESLYYVGTNSPLSLYASGWSLNIAHGHNGYLDVLATMGIIGLLIIIYTFIIKNFIFLFKPQNIDNKRLGLYYSLMCFIVLHNFLETTLMTTNKSSWILILIITALLHFSTKNYSKVYNEKKSNI